MQADPDFVMQADELPQDVQRLLREHIESYEQLELLLLLRVDGGRCWTEEEMRARLAVSATLVAEALAGLQSRGFVAARPQSAEKCYCYVTQSGAVEATIGRLELAYRQHPIPIVKLMSANAIERVRTAALRTFADAFIIKKDKNRG